PQTNKGRTVATVGGIGIDPDDRANLSRFLGLLLVGVGVMLIIACANVAGFLLVCATRRQREIVIRLVVGATRRRLIRLLLTEGQVAVTFVLLAGAGLSLRSMRAILTTSSGFDSKKVLLGRIDLTIQGYSAAKWKMFYRQLLERLQSSPGVISASLAMTVPP